MVTFHACEPLAGEDSNDDLGWGFLTGGSTIRVYGCGEGNGNAQDADMVEKACHSLDAAMKHLGYDPSMGLVTVHVEMLGSFKMLP